MDRAHVIFQRAVIGVLKVNDMPIQIIVPLYAEIFGRKDDILILKCIYIIDYFKNRKGVNSHAVQKKKKRQKRKAAFKLNNLCPRNSFNLSRKGDLFFGGGEACNLHFSEWQISTTNYYVGISS